MISQLLPYCLQPHLVGKLLQNVAAVASAVGDGASLSHCQALQVGLLSFSSASPRNLCSLYLPLFYPPLHLSVSLWSLFLSIYLFSLLSALSIALSLSPPPLLLHDPARLHIAARQTLTLAVSVQCTPGQQWHAVGRLSTPAPLASPAFASYHRHCAFAPCAICLSSRPRVRLRKSQRAFCVPVRFSAKPGGGTGLAATAGRWGWAGLSLGKPGYRAGPRHLPGTYAHSYPLCLYLFLESYRRS